MSEPERQPSKKRQKSPRKKWIKKRGKRLIRRINEVLARQSRVPDQAWFERDLYPWVERLESAAPKIRGELDHVLGFREDLPPLHELQPDQYRISGDNQWRSLMLTGWGHRAKTGAELCPETMALVESIPGVRNAFFSLLAPRSEIPDHRGLSKGALRVHLALKVPKDRERCVMRVDGREVPWEEGHVMIFDDTYLHGVRNDTDEERVVLLLHVDRPMRWLGRLLHGLVLFALRRSYFVKDGIRNHEAWEARFQARLAGARASEAKA